MSNEQKKDNEPVESAGIDAGADNQDEVSPKIYLSHDGLFRVTFDNKKLAESFVRENLPPEITKDLDFLSMTLDKDTFVDQKLSRCYSDMLYYIHISRFQYKRCKT